VAFFPTKGVIPVKAGILRNTGLLRVRCGDGLVTPEYGTAGDRYRPVYEWEEIKGMSITYIIETIICGILFGGIYTLSSAGFSLTWGP
jgi:hypothetical protein